MNIKEWWFRDMEIPVGEKNRIREMYKDRNYKGTVKELTKLYNKDYNEPIDKHFILYNLALYTMKVARESGSDDYDISRFYLNEAIEYFEELKNEYTCEYYDLIWLSVEVNKNILSNEDIIEKYTMLYNYFKSIKYKRNEIGMKINILKIKGEYDAIPNILMDIKDTDEEDIKDLITDILQECKCLGSTYYEMALNIIAEKKNYVAL